MGGAPKVNFSMDETSERRPQRSRTTVQAALRLDDPHVFALNKMSSKHLIRG
jgi:hypothetical protein